MSVLITFSLKSLYLLVKQIFMSDSRKRHEALLYHAKPKPGKIEVIPTKKYATQHGAQGSYGGHMHPTGEER